MSTTVELNATEIAQRLLPLLKEYAAKMVEFSKDAEEALGTDATLLALLKAVRLLCVHETLEKPVTDLAREASGLIEHAALEYHLRAELKLRLDELEEHIKFTWVLVEELRTRIIAHSPKTEVERLRSLVENKGGRYKAPF